MQEELLNAEEHKDQENITTEQTQDTQEQKLSDDLSAKLDDEGANLAAQVAELNDKYIRLYSEFENFKRRTNKERIELFKTANQEVLSALLPVLDDFERSVKAAETTTEVTKVKEGIVLVQNKLNNIVESKGLKSIDVKQGDTFNVDLHEAITNIPAPSEDLKGKIIDVVEKGYTLNEKVIRFAKVVIGE